MYLFYTKETSGISGGPKVERGFGWAPPKPIHWLPCVEAKERENHPHYAINPRMKEPPKMNHNHWIWISQINDEDVTLIYKQTR